jgi:hypothetical protein
MPAAARPYIAADLAEMPRASLPVAQVCAVLAGERGLPTGTIVKVATVYGHATEGSEELV